MGVNLEKSKKKPTEDVERQGNWSLHTGDAYATEELGNGISCF